MRTALAVLTSCLPAFTAAGQPGILLADRNIDALWRLVDADGNNQIADPSEVSLFFDGTNAAGTLAPQNPTALNSWFDGRVVMGDQVNRCVYVLRDLDGDGNAQGVGESLVAADASNLSGASFAFPVGVAFDSAGVAYVVNAGNALGADAVYRLVDLNGDGDFNDEGEITAYVGEGGFGPGNGPFSPQEAFFDPSNTMFIRNSSSSGVAVHGVYRAVDLNHNGKADDPGEFTLFFGPGNASGLSTSAGFAVEPDPLRPGSIYMLLIATGGVDVVYRLTDLNGDGDAMDSGESVEVWRTGETGFTSIDLLALADGSLLVSDNSGKRVARLEDLDDDGLFSTTGERTDYFVSVTGPVGDVRQLTPVYVCRADFNQDGFLDFFDLDAFVGCFEGVACPPRAGGDFDGDGFSDFFDLDAYLAAFDLGC
ncbi:MAG: hypothetical protein HRU70_05695 [Phycisphaeraceae bacterium]|nr:MAG: hypothetical protein HRU70_05695 [Phycisphaeraceae bacterium]